MRGMHLFVNLKHRRVKTTDSQHDLSLFPSLVKGVVKRDETVSTLLRPTGLRALQLHAPSLPHT